MKRLSLFFCAGEPSGDSHGAKLIQALQRLCPEIHCYGLGGEKMAQAGMEVVFPLAETPIMGVWGIFSHIPTLSRAYEVALKGMRRHPDAVVLIDYPGFNLQLARVAKSWGIPVIYYIAPQVWAWWQSRIRRIAKRVDKMLVILPFEEKFFQQAGIDDAEYVGHPVWDELSSFSLTDSEIKELVSTAPLIGLFPGSRTKEIRYNLPLFLQAARKLGEKYSFAIAALDEKKQREISRIQKSMGTHYPVLVGKTHPLMSVSHFAFVTSGTATLELLFFQVPMVVCYRADPISVVVGKRILAIPYFSLPNILAGEQIVPEFLLSFDDWQTLWKAALPLLEEGEERKKCIKNLKKVSQSLAKKQKASYNAAKSILQFLGRF